MNPDRSHTSESMAPVSADSPQAFCTSFALSDINQMEEQVFVDAFGDLFEQTAAIAHTTWTYRPFADADALYEAMVRAVQALNAAEQLALIRAHPDLGSNVKMAEASVQEQASAGLDSLTPQEFEQFKTLNQRYRETFGFPLLICVRHHTKTSILQAFEERLMHTAEEERDRAMAEILQIVRLRLGDRLTPPGLINVSSS